MTEHQLVIEYSKLARTYESMGLYQHANDIDNIITTLAPQEDETKEEDKHEFY